MLFHSVTFIGLLIPTLLAWWLVPSQTVRLAALFAASLVFYAFRHWPSVFLLLGTIGFNYVAARWQEKRRSPALLAATVAADLGLLFWFKYAAFASTQLVHLLAWLGVGIRVPTPSVWLPLGISFFTFQVVAYQVDVYRGTVPAERNVLVFAVFKAFFAQLIAGPIVRAKEMLPQLRRRPVFDAGRLQYGLFLFLVGIGLKIGVADVLRQFGDEAFAHPADLPTTDAWLGIFAFAFQLFADFWGYSTMARGLGEMFGLELPNNFDAPYLAGSLQAFWRRWHITLSGWFRDYVYVPLGGNRKQRVRNVVLTMTAAGLWHGAGWNYILWGFLHGCWLAVEGLFRATGPPTPPPLWRRAVATLTVFLGVCALWVLFRAPSFDVAWVYLGRLFLPPYRGHGDVPETLVIWLVGFALLHPLLSRSLERERFFAASPWRQVAVSGALLLLALAYGGQRYDFVYFAF